MKKIILLFSMLFAFLMFPVVAFCQDGNVLVNVLDVEAYFVSLAAFEISTSSIGFTVCILIRRISNPFFSKESATCLAVDNIFPVAIRAISLPSFKIIPLPILKCGRTVWICDSCFFPIRI